MTDSIENAAREQVAKFLPAALNKAALSYQKFLDSTEFDSSKKFSDHHAACKVAIAHIELLLKLARWADVKLEDSISPDLARLLAQSSADNEAFSSQEDDISL